MKYLLHDRPPLTLFAGLKRLLHRHADIPPLLRLRVRSHLGCIRVEVRTVRAMTELHMQVEPTGDCKTASLLAEQIETALKASLSIRVPVTLVESGTLPRFEMKAKRWVRV